MLETYLRARRIVALAALCVLLASGIIVTSFYRHVRVPCRGALEEVPVSQLSPLAERVAADNDGLSLDFELARSADEFRSVRVKLDADCPCKGELTWEAKDEGPWYGRSYELALLRGGEPGLYVLGSPSAGGRDVFAFRHTDATGHVFSTRQLPSANNVSILIMLGSIAALAVAGVLLARARSYTLTMSTWRSARRRADGMLEDESGVALGRLGRDTLRTADVLVNPSKVDGRSAYREFPILDRRDVAPGTHAQWAAGTFRRFRDARTLAILSVVTTVLAVAAQIVAAAR